MCGILCCVTIRNKSDNIDDIVRSDSDDVCPVCNEDLDRTRLLKTLLESRGPDISGSATAISTDKNTGDCTATVHLSGQVLWTQGIQPEPQPYVSSQRTNYLLFNGDLYNEATTTDIDVGKFHDGLHLFHRLEQSSTPFEFVQVISSLEGPFAFIYYDSSNNALWFGRDFFGRESLLASYGYDIGADDIVSLVISSVSVFQNIFEIPAAGVYYFNIFEKQITLFQWQSHPRDQISMNLEQFKTFLVNRNVILKVDPLIQLKGKRTLLKTVPSDLGSQVVLQNLASLGALSPEEHICQATAFLSSEIQQFLLLLREAVRKRVITQPPYCKNCVNSKTQCNHSRIGVLFSGGIDSTVLAYLAAECLEPGQSLDLLNVAFFQDGKVGNNIPDRETGQTAFNMLVSKFPSIDIKFIPVNVIKSQLEVVRQGRIRHLIAPLTSVLDDSIGCCLWFAASGNSESTARILLVGAGADELLGGYSRHRSAYKNGGWESLRQEMQFDVDRISVRNLGRDNRIISDHGVAPRIPFLDEDVVQFLTGECDLWIKCCHLAGFQRGVGEKLLLRAAALTLFGIQYTELVLFPKRAMQFGSRIAKLENSKERGSDSCKRLTLADHSEL